MNATDAFAKRLAAVLAAAAMIAATAAGGCWRSSGPGIGPEVVVYTALDSEFSQPILDQFAAETGIYVLPKFDTESTKTVGLAEAIRAEAARPRCDVFWNNEILNTLRLQREGLLAVCRPRAAEDYPAMYRSPDGLWYGFAARARVLVVNTDLVPAAERPDSIFDLADPKWRGRCAMAKPLFGTTATHAACLFAVLGEERAREFFQAVKHNQVQILSGNRQVALSVGAGRVAFGLTDTDDAMIELEKGMPVAIVYPDQPPPEPRATVAGSTAAEEPLGTLFIPNTLAVIEGGPHPESAQQLIEYLLSPEVETRLAQGRSAQIPLGRRVRVEPRVVSPRTIKPMQVDFQAAADQWDTAARFVRDLFTGPS